MRRLLTCLCLLALCLPAWGQVDPSQAPALPSRAPRGLAPGVPAPPAGVKPITINLKPGWNAISFPFSKLRGASGFGYELIAPSPQGELFLDPQAHPERIDTTKAFWAYSDRPRQALAWGDTSPVAAISLEPGWNFVGCPSPTPLELWRMTLSDGVTQGLTVEQSAFSAPPWLYSSAFVVRGDKFEAIGTRRTTNSLSPGQGHWIFAYRNALIRTNIGTHKVPEVTALQRSGQDWILRGRNFGSPQQGYLILDVERVPSDEIRLWTDTMIQVAGRPNAHPRLLTVVANGVPGPRVRDTDVARLMQSAPASAAAVTQGGLQLTVYDEGNEPVVGAQVALDGATASTDSQGLANFANLAPGPHQLAIRASGYRPVNSQVDIPTGRTYRLMATLSSPSAPIYVKAYPYKYGAEFRPYKIDIYERANYSRRYSNSWNFDQAGSYVDLNWNDCRAGQT